MDFWKLHTLTFGAGRPAIRVAPDGSSHHQAMAPIERATSIPELRITTSAGGPMGSDPVVSAADHLSSERLTAADTAAREAFDRVAAKLHAEASGFDRTAEEAADGDLLLARAALAEARQRLAAAEAARAEALAARRDPREASLQIRTARAEVDDCEAWAAAARSQFDAAFKARQGLIAETWERLRKEARADVEAKRRELHAEFTAAFRGFADRLLELWLADVHLEQTSPPIPPGPSTEPVATAEDPAVETVAGIPAAEPEVEMPVEDRRRRARELSAEGMSTREIAERLGCSQPTIVRDLRVDVAETTGAAS